MIASACPECGEELAADQRYCVNCGHRVEASLAPSYHPVFDGGAEMGSARRGFPIPIPVATTIAAVTLGFGVVMGTAISPNLSGLVAGEHIAGPTVAQAPAPEPEQPAKKQKGTSDFASPGTSGTSFGSSGFYGSTGTTGSTGGSGGVAPDHDKKKPKPKPDYTFLTGTVVHQNPVAGSYSISAGAGLSAIHTSKALPSIGTQVKVPIRVLANGTYAEEAKRQVKGTAPIATFTGVVTDSRDGLAPGDPDVYTVSARGASVLVFAPDATGTTASPFVGTLITTTVEIRNSVATTFPPPLPPGSCPAPPASFPGPPTIYPSKQLFQTAVQTVPTPVTTTVIETVVQSACTAPGRTVLSSDDIRQGQSDVHLLTAAGIDPAKLIPGEALMASVTIVGTTLTEVTGTASDQGIKGADSAAGSQGNLARVARKTDIRVAKAASRGRR